MTSSPVTILVGQGDALAYIVRYAGTIGIGTPSGPTHNAWSGDAIVAAGRGRMNFALVSGTNMFDSGDYALFDDAGAIIVKPGRSTFAPVKIFVSPARTAIEQRVVIEDLKTTFETLPDRDIVAGQIAVHCRVVMSYRMGMTAPGTELVGPDEIPHPATVSTSDYWYAKVDGLPANPIVPFMSGVGMDGTSGQPQLATAWKSVMQKLQPLGSLLRFRAAIDVQAGDARNQTSIEGEISDIHRLQVLPGSLVLPDGFTGGESPGAGDLATRWRSPH